MSCDFTDESLDLVEFKSSWKKERSVTTQECQTREVYTDSVEVQSYECFDQEVQTDSIGDFGSVYLSKDDYRALADFLNDVEPMFDQCLTNNLKTRAFEGLLDEKEGITEAAVCVHTLSYATLNEQLQVTGISWNSTGSTVAASYGRFDHEDWCTHKAAIGTWNLDRRSIKEDKPDTAIDSSCCIMCIEFHPVNPAWLAGGNYNGEVLLWDLSKEDDLLLATSKIGDDSHREPVSKVHWIKSQSSKRREYDIVSVSGDGKVLVWKVEERKGKLKLHLGFVLMSQSLPRSMKVRGIRGDKEVGITSISFSHEDPDLFILGSESGCMFKCNLHAKGSPAGSHIISSVPLCSPVTFTYQPHHGPVHSVECAHFHRNGFMSAGMDQSIRIYNMLQDQPVLTIEPSDGYLFSAKWSPSRPSVLGVVTEKGHLLIYDLRSGQLVPLHKLEASPNKVPVFSLQFNRQQKRLVATGDGQGYVKVFSLGDSLTSMAGSEIETLEELIASDAD